jgi:hypothetical protein
MGHRPLYQSPPATARRVKQSVLATLAAIALVAAPAQGSAYGSEPAEHQESEVTDGAGPECGSPSEPDFDHHCLLDRFMDPGNRTGANR